MRIQRSIIDLKVLEKVRTRSKCIGQKNTGAFLCPCSEAVREEVDQFFKGQNALYHPHHRWVIDGVHNVYRLVLCIGV